MQNQASHENPRRSCRAQTPQDNEHIVAKAAARRAAPRQRRNARPPQDNEPTFPQRAATKSDSTAAVVRVQAPQQ